MDSKVNVSFPVNTDSPMLSGKRVSFSLGSTSQSNSIMRTSEIFTPNQDTHREKPRSEGKHRGKNQMSQKALRVSEQQQQQNVIKSLLIPKSQHGRGTGYDHCKQKNKNNLLNKVGEDKTGMVKKGSGRCLHSLTLFKELRVARNR